MKKKIYEGKAKVLYQGKEPNTIIQYFKDDATAFNNKKKATIPGKGVLNNFISELIMTRLNDINIPNHIIVFDWASHEEFEAIISLSQRFYDFLTGYFYSQKIRLVDFKLEFGRFWENQEMTIMVADEISPDNCRLWDLQTNEKLDKDRFRQDLGNVDRAYKEVAYRLGVLSEKEFKKVLKNDI